MTPISSHSTIDPQIEEMARRSERGPEDAPIQAPDFELTDIQGKRVCLSDFRGKHPVVLVLLRGFV
jgi:cytochrome oxidase Cu insertion factor (SCO1/SenC/PrrC family)